MRLLLMHRDLSRISTGTCFDSLFNLNLTDCFRLACQIMPLTLEILRIMKGPRVAIRTSPIAPLSLQNSVPLCSQKCLATTITQTFASTACSNATDLECLCSRYSTQGLTLGEAALVCLNANCPKSYLNATSSLNAFNICSSQSDAVTATHKILTSFETATAQSGASTTTESSYPLTFTSALPQPSSPSASLRESSSADKTSTASFSLAMVSTTGSRSSMTIPVGPSETTPPSWNTNATTITAQPSGQSSVLTKGQAVGVAFGAIGGLGGLVALVFCCVVLRRKAQKKEKKKAHRSFDFVDKSPGLESAFRQHCHSASSQQRKVGRPVTPDFTMQTTGAVSHSDHAKAHDLGLKNDSGEAVRPTTQWLEPAPTCRPATQWPKPIFAPSTNDSNRWKPPRPPRPYSDATMYTVFDEDHGSSQIKSLPSVASSPFPPRQNSVVAPVVARYFAEQYTTSRDDVYQPSLSLEIPAMPNQYTSDSRVPPPLDLTPYSPLRSGSMSMAPNSAISYLPAYYTSNDSRTPVVSYKSPDQLSYPYLPPKLPTTKPPHLSYASDTTFDSIDPNDVTPPDEEDKRLSAVAESPLSGLRYPKIPRPSNQAVPRSPPQSRWTAPTSFTLTSERPSPHTTIPLGSEDKHSITLLSKRRGDDAAQRLEQRLHISSQGGTSSLYSQTSTILGLRVDETGSPSMGHETASRGRPRSPELVIKSPLWEPELTPSKRGDDLFISVH